MKFKAYAKINISLDVIGKREDGYHLLEMIMQNIDLYDDISIEKIETGISISCNKKYVPVNEKNLAFKAAKLFMEKYNIESGVKIHINKNIPVSAGMAGGSTDAAAVLNGMNKIYNINADIKELMELGVKIGADVPYCIQGGTAYCEGIGEIVTPLKHFKNHILVIVKPPFGISTKEAYEKLKLDKIYRHPNTKKIIEKMEEDDLKFVAENMRNLLENVVLGKHRVLINIKDKMKNEGALGAMMSGSGPTVFGLFDDMLKAQHCFEKFKHMYKDVYITRTI